MRTLPAKRALTDVDAGATWERIADLVPRDVAEQAVARAVEETLKVIGRRSAVYGWSGGKDSQALRVVAEQAGIRRSVLGIIPALEWRGYLDWLPANAPAGLVTYRNEKLTLPWLAAHQQYLFPTTSRLGYFWALESARFAQRRYQDEHRPAFQVFGRRTVDGNVCGKDGITVSRGLVSYNPLRGWSHELVLAVCHYFGMGLPPVYFYPHGWRAGTGTWSGRRVGSVQRSWEATYAAEPDVVTAAAAHIPSARAWLAGR